MDFEIGSVAANRIDTADRTFQITTRTDKADLAPTIGAIGLLQPPVLIPKGPDYTVVCGFRRIAACQSLNLQRIAARLLGTDTPGLQCARMAVADNAFQRPLNVVEQSRAFALIRKFAADSPSWLQIAASTGLPDSRSAMERLAPVAAMPATIQKALLEGSIALPIALQLDRLEKAAALALGDLLRKISTGLNIQRELVAMITDISRRDDIPIARLVEQDDIKSLVNDAQIPSPQKAQHLRRLLKMQRYPELSRAEAQYRRTLKSLKLNPQVQLQPPPFFEGKTYRVTLTVDSRRQLKSLQLEVEKLARHPSLLPE